MSHRKNLRIWLAISMFLVAMAGLAQATTVTVGPGTGYDFDTIQAGIDAAMDADMVLVAPGEYVITEPITFRGKAITLISETGPDETTIRMGTPADPNRGSVVVFENNETIASILDGFTITGGKGYRFWDSDESRFEWHGGGILFNASSATVKNCTIVQNSTEDSGRTGDCGGGVFVGWASSAILTNCIISRNSCRDTGGGLFCWQDSSVTLTDCTIMDNSATGVTAHVNGYGGGLFCGRRCLLTLVNCDITENSAGVGGGGAMCWDNSSLEMANCEIMGNTAKRWGGGVHCDTASATLTNCIIARNSTPGIGGGMFCPYQNSFITLSNCTVWGNSAAQSGGGIKCWGGSATVMNSILWANTAPNGPEISLQAAGRSSLTYSNIAGGKVGIHVQGGTLNWGEGNIDADPLFARLGYWDDNGTRESSDDFWVDGDYHLKSQAGRWNPESQAWIQDDVTSPCIDVGDPMCPIGWELFPNGGFVNIGAYGSTPKASKSYFGELVCETIVAGDINGDGQVNRVDLEIMALHWTDEEPLLP